MSSKIKKNILKLKESSTLVINEKSKDLIKRGKKVYQFGFGQSPFPVPEKIVETLKKKCTQKRIFTNSRLTTIKRSYFKVLRKKNRQQLS